MQAIKSIVKYPGGKQREHEVIKELMPSSFNRYIEPFVGGGSVYCAVASHEYFINDKSEDLMNLYQQVKDQNQEFFAFIKIVDDVWRAIDDWDISLLLSDYQRRLSAEIDAEQLVSVYLPSSLKSSAAYLDGVIARLDTSAAQNFTVNLLMSMSKKMERMVVLDHTRRHLPPEDIYANILGVAKAGCYGVLRSMYNKSRFAHYSDAVRAVLYLYIRDFCYSSMFRFSSSGDFNVPYGGISYNSKNFVSHIALYQRPELIERMNHTTLSCVDYCEFLDNLELSWDDFMFVDPPYDSRFSTYDGNSFDEDEQTRLRDVLLDCPCKFLMIVRRTELLDSLYVDRSVCANGNRLHIAYFDKKYSVSFMNRNDKDCEHMVVMNYGA